MERSSTSTGAYHENKRAKRAVAEPPIQPRPIGVGAGAIATGAATIVYFVATGAEMLLIRILRPTEMELAWVSDAILAFAFGSAVFLWLHLKSTRLTLSRLERERIVLDTQLSLAAEIQRDLLPAIPPDGSGLHWAARLVQAGRIGGDVYDFVQLGDGSWLVLVGDVSGKGVPAALVLASIRTMFRMLTAETSDPGALVQRMSQRLYEDHGGMPYLTCVVVKVNLHSHELAYVNAGHPPGIVVDPSDDRRAPQLLVSSGPPAGLFPNQVYQTLSIAPPPGAVSILVSDGITEALDVLGLTDRDPVAALLAQAPRPLTLDRLCDALIERTTPALAKGEWQDDRTVVAFSFDSRPATPPMSPEG